MHIHIHSLIYYARHARLLGGSLRYLAAMLLVLFSGLLDFDFVSAKPASAVRNAKESSRFTVDFFCRCSAINILGASELTMDPGYCGIDRTDHAPPDATNRTTHASLFCRFRPGIVAVPRMNRIPKPKSVYRCFTRAPGIGHCREV